MFLGLRGLHAGVVGPCYRRIIEGDGGIEHRRKGLGFHTPHPSRFGFQLFGFRVQGDDEARRGMQDGMSATTYPACSVPWFRINDIPEASLVVQARAYRLLN